MNSKEIHGDNQDQFLDLIAIYGEAYLIKYLAESILDKERIVREHEE